ncbi:MAG: beta-ACP synthase, partial [Alistipes sp.]|nr:beta-ACP synthase [Alistipes sp.]
MANKAVEIYLGASSLRTALGNKRETLDAMRRGVCGLKYEECFGMYAGRSEVATVEGYSRFESLIIEQLDNILAGSAISLKSEDVQLVLSTTKGNIDLLAEDCENIAEATYIYTSAEAIARRYDAARRPIVISNACISGVSAFVVARELLQSGKVKHVIVAGGDALSEFITAGFASFKSISAQPCRPYDAERDGLTLGEAAGAVILTTDEALADEGKVRLAGGAISNDANHISGPSRTGDGLYYAIANAMREAGVAKEDVGFVNTHGTATRYNDEMESKAVAWAELTDKPLNSL